MNKDIENVKHNYIHCPNCNASIFEKNLARHMNSNRCRTYQESSDLSKGSSQDLNKSMVCRLVNENKVLKDSLAKSEHQNFCAEQLFYKLIDATKNEGDSLKFKKDQSTQTIEGIFHIDF